MLNKNYKSRYFIIIFTLLLLSIKTFLLARLPTNVILFNGDTNSYLTYSENFGSLIFGANPPFAELGLIRTPGYPFFLLLLKFISLKELIFIQLVMGSAISLVTYKICKIFKFIKILIYGVYLKIASKNLAIINFMNPAHYLSSITAQRIKLNRLVNPISLTRLGLLLKLEHVTIKCTFYPLAKRLLIYKLICKFSLFFLIFKSKVPLLRSV